MFDAPSRSESQVEAELLREIARLYAALIRVVRSIEDPALRAEIADLVWPKEAP